MFVRARQQKQKPETPPDSTDSDASSSLASDTSLSASDGACSPVVGGAGEVTAGRQSSVLSRLGAGIKKVSSMRSLLSSGSKSPSPTKEEQVRLHCAEFVSPEWSDVSVLTLPTELPVWPVTQVKPLGQGDEGIRDAFVADDGSKIFLIKTPASVWKLCFGLPELDAAEIAPHFFADTEGKQLPVEVCYARVNEYLSEHTPLDLMGHAVAQGLQEEMVANLAKVICGRLSPKVSMSVQQSSQGAVCVTETWRVPDARPCSDFCSAHYGDLPADELSEIVDSELNWLLSLESGFFQCMLARLLLVFADANPDSLLIQTKTALGRRCYLIDYESGLAEVDLLDPHGLSAAERARCSTLDAAVAAVGPAENLLEQFATLCHTVAAAFIGHLSHYPEKDAVLERYKEEVLPKRLKATVTVSLMRRLLSLLDFSYLAQAEARLNVGLTTYFSAASEDSAVVNHLKQRLEYVAWRIGRFLDVFKVKLATPLSMYAHQFESGRRDLRRLASLFNIRQQAPILLLADKVLALDSLEEMMALYSKCFSRAVKTMETAEERFGGLLECLVTHGVDLDEFKVVMLKLSTNCCALEASKFSWNRIADSLNQMRDLMRTQKTMMVGFECVTTKVSASRAFLA